MYKDKKILAIIPARGGSKGVPKKNIHPLMGKPLIQWTAELVKDVSLIDRSIVSTDSKEISDVAVAHGLEVPFFRPENLSGDRIGDLEVLQHSLIEMERINGYEFDIILMLQPTSPLRKKSHVEDCIVKIVDESKDAVWTVSEVDLKYHPLKQLTYEGNELRLFSDEGKKIIARQQLKPTYYRNGGCYAFTRNCLLDKKSIYGERTGAVITSGPMVSIDTLEDFLEVEKHL